MTTCDILRRYAAVARPIIRQDFAAASCIASTAITIEVLRLHGISAVPFPCKVLVFNAPFVQRIEREDRFPDAAETIVWTTGTDLWSVGLGFSRPHEQHVGHYVALAEGRYLIDASIDQASRPEKGINLPPVMVGDVNPDFRDGKAGTNYQVLGPGGELVWY